MTNLSYSAAVAAISTVAHLVRLLLSDLEHRRRINAVGILRSAMESAFATSDATGASQWKAAYEACEAATAIFLRKYVRSIRAKAGSDASMLSILAKVESLLPTHRRRCEESETRQPFSRSMPLGTAVGITDKEGALETSTTTVLFA